MNRVTLASAMFLLVISPIILLITLAMFSFSDVHHTYDFLAPVLGIAQLVFIVGLYRAKRWGLIGFSVIVVGLAIAILSYYLPKGESRAAINTLLAISPLLLLTIYYWTAKRSYFQ